MGDLYLQSSDLRLSLHQQKIIVRNGERFIVKEVAMADVENVLVFGHANLTTPLLKALAQKGVNIYYFTATGQFLSALDTYREADFEKQFLQAKAAMDGDFCLNLARQLIAQKVEHQYQLLLAYDEERLLDRSDLVCFDEGLRQIREAESLAVLMGYEGRLAKSYFYYLSLLVPDPFRFYGRSKRPAKDPVNAMLNWGYSLLYGFFIGMIRKNGLSQGFGIMHQARRHHATLASDLMEEWRPVIVDDTVMTLLCSNQVFLSDFEKNEQKGVILSPRLRQILSQELKERMLEIHHYLPEDEKRYTFIYAVDRQIKRLIRAYEAGAAEIYGKEGADE